MHLSIASWSEQAVCKGYSHLFYANDNERPQARERRENKAKLLCSKCPVVNECREHARKNTEFGIWGGENEEERYLAGFELPRYAGVNISRRLKNQRKKESI